jgi:hypothetical protein
MMEVKWWISIGLFPMQYQNGGSLWAVDGVSKYMRLHESSLVT